MSKPLSWTHSAVCSPIRSFCSLDSDRIVIALVAYEYFITFGQEIASMWRRGLNGATILFFLNRYLMVLSVILVYVPFTAKVRYFPDASQYAHPIDFSTVFITIDVCDRHNLWDQAFTSHSSCSGIMRFTETVLLAQFIVFAGASISSHPGIWLDSKQYFRPCVYTLFGIETSL